MLVLTRKDGEKILVGKDITITVVKSKNGQVRIGIEAPKGISICREEIADTQSAPNSEVVDTDKAA